MENILEEFRYNFKNTNELFDSNILSLKNIKQESKIIAKSNRPLKLNLMKMHVGAFKVNKTE